MAKFSNGGREGGKFIKVQDHAGALAFAVEGKRIEKDVPNPSFPAQGPRDLAHTDTWVFRNKDELDGSAEPLFLEGAIWSNSMLVGAIEESMENGETVIGRVERIPLKSGNSGYVFRKVDDSVFDHVVNYLTALDEEVNNVELPDF